MKFPEVDPELHGLLDEVVQDPRSALRRTPRRALIEWFGNPTATHARPIDVTTAERHLVAVYRESLAEIFRVRALLIFLHAPQFCHPWRDPEGKQMDLSSAAGKTEAKLHRAIGFARTNSWQHYEELFTHWPGASGPDGAFTLAKLSLQLAPTDFGRFTVALTFPRSEPMEAIGIQQKLAVEAREPHRRMDALNDLAGRMAELGWMSLACEQYERALEIVPWAIESRCYALNLSCFMMDRDRALFHSNALEEAVAGKGEVRIKESGVIIHRWMLGRGPAEVARVSRFLRSLGDRLSPGARTLMEGI